jgi:hypothetical protein
LHDYVPFEVPRVINTTEDGEIQALGSGTLRFAAAGSNGQEVFGELPDVYYLPDIRTRLISVGQLFDQGWEPRLSRNGFAIYDKAEPLIIRVPKKNKV